VNIRRLILPFKPRGAPMLVGPDLNGVVLLQVLPSLLLRRLLFRRD
jgi:hypothetical protein